MSEPSVFERVVAEALCIEPDERNSCDGLPWRHPRCALHAIATSDEVQAVIAEALVRRMEDDGLGDMPCRDRDAEADAGAILDAFRPDPT